MEPYVRRTAGYVARVMPGLDPEPVSVRLCVSTHLPQRGDAFSTWRAEGVTVFAGHNLFKFAPVLGELLADAVTAGTVADVLTIPATGSATGTGGGRSDGSPDGGVPGP